MSTVIQKPPLLRGRIKNNAKENVMEKELQKYLYPVRISSVIWMVFVLIVSVLVIPKITSDMPEEGFPVVTVSLIISAALLCILPIIILIVRRKKLAGRDDLDVVLNEFQDAEQMADDRIRLGGTWVFCKGGGMPVPYEDIRSIYKYSHTTIVVFIPINDKKMLKISDTSGKTRNLLNLKWTGLSDQEVLNIVAMIVAHNPAIMIGNK